VLFLASRTSCPGAGGKIVTARRKIRCSETRHALNLPTLETVAGCFTGVGVGLASASTCLKLPLLLFIAQEQILGRRLATLPLDRYAIGIKRPAP
jgi:hypothetical protein